MSNFTTITEYLSKFGPHHLSPTFPFALNNTYSEQFDDAVTTSFFTNSAQTAVDQDVDTKIKNAIIDTIEINSQMD